MSHHICFFCSFVPSTANSDTSTVLKYLNAHNVNMLNQIPNVNASNASSILPYNPFNSKVLSPTTPHSHFMYANWIDLHAKTPDQTNYLFCLQGNFLVHSHLLPNYVVEYVVFSCLHSICFHWLFQRIWIYLDYI